MMETPERIWLLWRDTMIRGRWFASELDHSEEGGFAEYVPAADLARLRAENAQLVAANQALVAREAEAREVTGVDRLAAIIRLVDGDNTRCAAELANRILSVIEGGTP